MKRVLICGPSGTGKSELANFIGLSLGIPFITTSTKPLWEKHGIKSHKELIKKGQEYPKWGDEFQWEVLKYRRDILNEELGGYVCDRSPIDNLAYYMLQNSMDMGAAASSSYANRCIEDLANQTDYIIRIKYNFEIELEDDGMRVNNPYFQAMTDGIFETIFQNDLMKISENFKPNQVLVINEWDWNTRIKKVQKFLDIDQNILQKALCKIKRK